MNPSDKTTYWQQHIDHWQQSGLSQEVYCQQHKLILSTFGYWRKRLRKQQAAASKLIPVSIARPALVNVFLPSDIRIEASLDILPELLPLLTAEVFR